MHKLILKVLIIALIAAITALVGCGTSGGAQLTLAVNNGVEGDALKLAAADYKAISGIQINIAELPYDNLFEKELIDLNAGTGAYDLIMLDDPWFPRFASEDLLTNFDSLFKAKGISGPDADFVPSSIAISKHPYQTGDLYALPYVGNSQLFFYRGDLFEKHNLKPPATWDDVLQAARVINESEKSGAPGGRKVYGYVMRAARGNAAVADFMPIFWSFGAEMFDEKGAPRVNSPEGIKALQFMIDLGKFAPPGYASFNATEVSAHLLQGTAAMSINWPAWISAFGDKNKTKVPGLVKFDVMPGVNGAGRAEIGNWLIAIPKASRHVNQAFEFLLWATSAEQMRKSALAGNPPTRRSVFTDPELVAMFPSYPAQLRSLETSKPRPRTPQWNEIENVFGIFISRANSGELSVEDAMNQANAEITKIVERNRK